MNPTSSTSPRSSVTPFLMFRGEAEEALTFYVETIPNSEILEMIRYAADAEGAPEGSVQVATISLNGQKVMCIDSPVDQDFTFTPAVSLYVNCETEEELDGIVEAFSIEGHFLMPPDNYGFSQKFAWVQDRFGVSWQVNLAH